MADDAAEARWRARFHAARVTLPDWARQAPDRRAVPLRGRMRDTAFH